MDTQRITCFLEAARLRSFTKAAERLFISQSTISRNIRALEAELNLELFTRSAKTVELTEAGKVLFEGLPSFVEQLSALQERAAFAQQGYTGEIRIGFLQGFMFDDFPQALKVFELQHPNIHVIIQTATIDSLVQKFLGGELDFFMDCGDNLADHTVQSVCIGWRPLALAIPANHPLAHSADMPRLIDFKNDVFVTLPPTSGPMQRNLFLRCAEAGFVPKKALIAQDLPTILLWIELGRCISFLYKETSLISNEHIRMLDLENLPMIPALICWNDDNNNVRCKRIFADYIRGYYEKRLPPVFGETETS